MKPHHEEIDVMAAYMEPELVRRLTDIIAHSPDTKTIGEAFTAELEKSGWVDWARVFLAGDEKGEGGIVLPIKNAPRHDLFVRPRTVVEAEPSEAACQQLGCPGRARSIIWLPLLTGTDIVGVLVVANLTGAADPAGQLPALQYLAGMLSLALQTKRLQQEAETMRRQDSEWLHFVDLLVHELKTSLTTVVSSAGLLKESMAEGVDELQVRLIQSLGESVSHLESTISELPNLIRARRRPVPTPASYCAVGPVLREALAHVKPAAQKRQQILTLDYPESLPRVAIGQNLLKQVLHHLLLNATESTPECGEITLRARADGDGVVIEIGDGASVIPKDKQPELFEPSRWVEVDSQWPPRLRFRVAVSKLLVESCGGKLWLDSEPGRGNIFGFSLPLSEGSSPDQARD